MEIIQLNEVLLAAVVKLATVVSPRPCVTSSCCGSSTASVFATPLQEEPHKQLASKFGEKAIFKNLQQTLAAGFDSLATAPQKAAQLVSVQQITSSCPVCSSGRPAQK